MYQTIKGHIFKTIIDGLNPGGGVRVIRLALAVTNIPCQGRDQLYSNSINTAEIHVPEPNSQVCLL